MGRKASRRRIDASFKLDDALQQDVLGVVLAALGAITLLSLLSVTHGAVSDWWADLLRRIFGWGSLVVAGLVIIVGISLLVRHRDEKWEVQWLRVIGLELVLGATLALLHLIASNTDPLSTAEAGRGGGLVGWAVSTVLLDAVGAPATVLLMGVLGVVGAVWALDVSIRRAGNRVATSIAKFAERMEEASEVVEPVLVPEPEPVPAPTDTKQAAARQSSRKSSRPSHTTSTAKVTTKQGLPPLELLDPGSPQRFQEAELRERVRMIEETLMSFDVPVKVVSVNQGPTITQFGVEPGYVERAGKKRKIRVNKITRLADDLALALAAAPVRIEAPVPGQSVVGIEVPNSDISVVSLRGVMESAQFRQIGRKSKLALALGRDVAGEAIAADLTKMPHLLIAGATGSGKSVCVNAIIATLLLRNTPQELKLMLVDPKRVELTNYNGIPHLFAPVIVETDEVVGALHWAQREMDRRYESFADARARNIETYNNKIGRREDGEPLPHVIVIIDELADLMMASPDEVERLICRLAQMARATGIHLVIATQRPSVDVVTGLIKANFPARISFAVTSGTDSRVVLDTVGAEKLLGEGDMLFLPPDASAPKRLQGSYVSDHELSKLTAFWHGTGWETIATSSLAPWAGIIEELDEEPDDMLDQAIELIGQHERVSTSFLQRRLHIGYPRAARLTDELEEIGLVGPDEGGGQGREVLMSDDEDDEFDEV
ncbi:MAG: DNA translocase SpoIIIE [Anaerolineales bacterium]|nr:DNA translocase SpoIIIE [Anaerolineales bacterium]